MRKIVLITVVVFLLAALCGCKHGVEPAVEPTEVPAEVTEAPVEPTEAPADPTQEPAGFDFAVIRRDEPLSVDIDGDGLEDTVLISTDESSEFGFTFTVKITRASGEEYTHSIKNEVYELNALAADFDPDDGRVEIVVGYEYDSNDYSTDAFRVKDDGSEVELFESGLGFSMEDGFVFDRQNGVIMDMRTDILGTHDVSAAFAVTATGFTLLSDSYSYPEFDDGWGKLTLKKDLELTLVNEDGSLGEKFTAPAGSVIAPFTTDLETYVTVKLDDGRVGRAEVEVKTGDEWGILLNGVFQDEYADIPYAD